MALAFKLLCIWLADRLQPCAAQERKIERFSLDSEMDKTINHKAPKVKIKG